MANQFSEEQRKTILIAFNEIDTDGDGKLTKGEVAELIQDMKCVTNQSQIDKIIDQSDADGNGTIEPGQFLALMARMMLSISAEKDILQSFKVLQGQNEGFITFDSLKEVLTKMGETKLTDDDIKNMIEEADLEGKGKVSLEQFKKLLAR